MYRRSYLLWPLVVVARRLSGVNGSKYALVRLRAANIEPPLCDSSAAHGSRQASELDRSGRVGTRCNLPRKSRIRSNETTLSLLVNSHTKHDSHSSSNVATGGPASPDHLELETSPTGHSFDNNSARGGLNRGAVSGPPSKDGVSSPPVVATHTLHGNGNNSGNTKSKARQSTALTRETTYNST